MLPIAALGGLAVLFLMARRQAAPTAAPAAAPPPAFAGFPPGSTFVTLLAPEFGDAASAGAPILQAVPLKLGTALVIYPPTNWGVPLTFEGYGPTESGIPAAAELAPAPFNPGGFGLAFVAQFPGEVRVSLSAPLGNITAYFAVDVTVSA